MKLEHNSQNNFYRTPVGAVTCNNKVSLRLYVDSDIWPEYVRLVCNIKEQQACFDMHFYCHLAGANIYEAQLDMPADPCIIFYHFEVKTNGNMYYYGNNKDMLGGLGEAYENIKSLHPFQITVYDKSFKTPDWLKNGVIYQIFPDRFAKSDSFDSLSLRDDIIKRNWNDQPYYKAEQFGGRYLANDFFGGSLKGIEEKLDYLQSLGVSIIYLNPIFEAYSNHKYDTGNYKKIDKMFGDEKAFSSLCKKAEALGIKVILDGVFNHTGADSIYFNKDGHYDSTGAYQSTSSPYYSWYNFKNYPDDYESWWGIKTLPQVNETNEDYMDYILRAEDSVIKKWIRLGASGWRLDVVDELPGEFLKILRNELKKENSDAAIIGEVWEDASNKVAYGELKEYLGGAELDSAMNYPLRSALIDFVKNNITAYDFNRRIMSLRENYPQEAFYAMMNFLSSHDTVRILTAISDAPDDISKDEQSRFFLSGDEIKKAENRLKLISTLLMCLPGAPCIFYGDEAGVQGYGDPFCRSAFPWDNINTDLYNHYKSLIKMRRDNHTFRLGELEFVYGESQVSGFVRYNEDDCILVLANTSEAFDHYCSLELGRLGIKGLSQMSTSEEHISSNGRFNVHINPGEVKIFKSNRYAAKTEI